MQCSQGHENAEGQRFCGMCGERLTAEAADDVDRASEEAQRPTMPVEGPAGSRQDDAAGGTGIREDEDGSASVESKQTGSEPGQPSVVGLGSRRRIRWVVAAGGLAAVGLVLVLVFVVFGGDDRESEYVSALEEQGLLDDFRSEAAAVRHAEGFCEELDEGGEPVGTEAENIGVNFYCPQYEEDFEILETRTFEGTFALTDSDGFSGGERCRGTGGYNDIREGTQVTVKNEEGTILETASLGPGTAESLSCTLAFEVELTEGEEFYVFEVGSRGELSYSWEELEDNNGVAFSLG